MKSLAFAVLFALVFAADLCADKPMMRRMWTDDSGRFTISASLEDIEVVLRTQDGKTQRVPINKLSAEDRAVVAKSISLPEVEPRQMSSRRTAGSNLQAIVEGGAFRFDNLSWNRRSEESVAVKADIKNLSGKTWDLVWLQIVAYGAHDRPLNFASVIVNDFSAGQTKSVRTTVDDMEMPFSRQEPITFRVFFVEGNTTEDAAQ